MEKRVLDVDKLVDEIYDLGLEDKKIFRTDEEIASEKDEDIRTIRSIIEPLVKLADEARRKRMYLYLECIDVWLAPDKLEDKLKRGIYIYGISEWTLRNPVEMVEKVEKEIREMKKDLRNTRVEISKYINRDEDVVIG